MSTIVCRSRKEQIKEGFYGTIRKAAKKAGIKIPASLGRVILEELKNAAMVGGFEERSRTLEKVTYDPSLRDWICSESVLKVLGYE